MPDDQEGQEQGSRPLSARERAAAYFGADKDEQKDQGQAEQSRPLSARERSAAYFGTKENERATPAPVSVPTQSPPAIAGSPQQGTGTSPSRWLKIVFGTIIGFFVITLVIPISLGFVMLILGSLGSLFSPHGQDSKTGIKANQQSEVSNPPSSEPPANVQNDAQAPRVIEGTVDDPNYDPTEAQLRDAIVAYRVKQPEGFRRIMQEIAKPAVARSNTDNRPLPMAVRDIAWETRDEASLVLRKTLDQFGKEEMSKGGTEGEFRKISMTIRAKMFETFKEVAASP